MHYLGLCHRNPQQKWRCKLFPEKRREEKRRDETRRDETRRDETRREEKRREEKRREEKRREEKRREEKRREESNTTNLATVTNLLQIAAWNFPRAPGATIRTTFYSWCSLTNNTHLHIHKSLSCTFLLSASRLVADWCKKHLECPVRLRLRGSDRTETTESVTTKCQEKFGSVFLSHQLHAVVKTQDWQCSALVSFKQHPADTLWRRKTMQGSLSIPKISLPVCDGISFNHLTSRHYCKWQLAGGGLYQGKENDSLEWMGETGQEHSSKYNNVDNDI